MFKVPVKISPPSTVGRTVTCPQLVASPTASRSSVVPKFHAHLRSEVYIADQERPRKGTRGVGIIEDSALAQLAGDQSSKFNKGLSRSFGIRNATSRRS